MILLFFFFFFSICLKIIFRVIFDYVGQKMIAVVFIIQRQSTGTTELAGIGFALQAHEAVAGAVKLFRVAVLVKDFANELVKCFADSFCFFKLFKTYFEKYL